MVGVTSALPGSPSAAGTRQTSYSTRRLSRRPRHRQDVSNCRSYDMGETGPSTLLARCKAGSGRALTGADSTSNGYRSGRSTRHARGALKWLVGFRVYAARAQEGKVTR
jgi:hypothetical protein